MARKPTAPVPGANTGDTLITRIIAPDVSEEALQELDEYRRNYEAEYGPTDLTKRYTSMLDTDIQQQLVESDPERYWAGLAPFLRSYLSDQLKACARGGNLDDCPAGFVKLYLAGKAKGHSGPSRS